MATQKPSLSRRQLLKVAGASALVLPGSKIFARGLVAGASVSLKFWDGQRFITATDLTGATTLDSVRIKIVGYGEGAVKSIDLKAKVQVANKAPQNIGIAAWTAPPKGVPTRFVAPVDRGAGVALDVKLASGETVAVQLGGQSAGRLKEGIYVLAPSTVNLDLYSFDAKRTSGPLVAIGGNQPKPQYVVLTVERA